jgi:1-acyl-sn-glycerol-3-phosphate acyltransferase
VSDSPSSVPVTTVSEDSSALRTPQSAIRNRISLTWRFAVIVLWPLVKWWLKTKPIGREILRRDRAQIIAANHTSQIDPVIIGVICGRETWFMAKEEIFKVSRFFGWLISTYNAMPVNRSGWDIAALKRCSDVLAQGKTLVLFPEGTRSKSGELEEFRSGVAMLAIMNNVPIVPAYISGLRRSFVPWFVDPDIVRWNKKHFPGKLKFRFASLFTSRVKVRFGKPIAPEGYKREKEDYHRMTAELRQRIVQMAADESSNA